MKTVKSLRTVRYAGQDITYELQRKKVKNVNLRVHPDGKVTVSANTFVGVKWIDDFVLKNGEMILSALAKYEKMREEGTDKASIKNRIYQDGDTIYLTGNPYKLRILAGKKDSVEIVGQVIIMTLKDPENEQKGKKVLESSFSDWCLKLMTSVSLKIYEEHFEKLGVSWPEIKIRSMTSRWGSCKYRDGVITYARQLLHAPIECAEYVALHEFSHFIHPDHSERFHAFVAERMPDWKERKKRLNSMYQDSFKYS